jgi:starvation-inducible DNA-binding protein
MKTNILGLPVKETEEIVSELNLLLSNYQVYYQNLRGSLEHPRKTFFDLHVKFEELYNDSENRYDSRTCINSRWYSFAHTFEDYIKHNKIVVGKNISNDEKAVQLIVDSLSHLLIIERAILDKSAAINDEGSNAMMSDFISEQEKIWMMQAWLEE